MRTLRTPLAVRGLIAVVLVVIAALLVPALRDEGRLERANEVVRADPATALREAASAVGPATRGRVAALSVVAYVRAGRLADAERVATADLAARPDDAYAARRLYEVQRLRFRRAAAGKTLELLRRLDPLYAAGTGQ